ncbi:thioesterase [candidate division KSB1 bacterium]|nr:thioesterase [candidate division KSB1 bacterium]
MNKDDFKFFTEIEVRVSDLNYGGHVGNDRYLSFFQDARIRYLNRFGYSELSVGENIGLIMSESHVVYKAQAFLGDVLKIGVRVSNMGSIKFDMEYLIVRDKDDTMIASGSTRMVGYDYAKMKVSKIPVDFYDRIRNFEE